LGDGWLGGERDQPAGDSTDGGAMLGRAATAIGHGRIKVILVPSTRCKMTTALMMR